MGICSAVILTPRESPLPGVCSPVEAGEVARVAWRRGGDLPRWLRLRLRMTLCHIQRETTSGKAGTLSAEFCRHVVKIVIDVLFHGERFGYIEVDRLLTVASDNAVGFTFH